MNASVVSADLPTLRRMVNRLTPDELLSTLLAWSDLGLLPGPLAELLDSEENLEETVYGPKRRFVNLVLLAYKGIGFTPLQIAHLDIKHASRAEGTRNWQTLRLVRENDVMGQIRHDEAKIEKSISACVAAYYEHHCYAAHFGNTIWVRLAIYEGIRKNDVPATASTIFLVYILHSNYLLYTKYKPEYEAVIMEALQRTFKAKGIEPHSLAGKGHAPLIELLTQKDAQGPYSKYRLGQVDINPLIHPSKKRMEGELSRLWLCYVQPKEPIVPEDAMVIDERENAVDEQFGRNSLPALPYVDYAASFPLYHRDMRESETTPLSIRVRIEGPNVIDGLRSLLAAGLAVPPLPNFLAELHSTAINSFRDGDLSAPQPGAETPVPPQE
ncbi:centromere protein Chl4/mis15/CENP-N [Thamnocephalis sphaerospora]|uniref:Centromere protein Chl4/mis15/CENP-N n=1 Tax=Thamnocephalis sphaerospora TaxID=78915 RepID=A0A4P9XU66_9FUNG|nr:centromere protein Chl4/mis15/CENP-N [Thamnocephalis sphaerospora]|eukprot:RKP08980.1 centromere protein Chl4/mis15/CENP-N [Thamnocephalis sphaerospora]